MNKRIIRRVLSYRILTLLGNLTKRELATTAYSKAVPQNQSQPGTFQPSLRTKPFSHPWESQYLDLSLDHQNNPLIYLTKEQISNLGQNEYRHLNNITFGSLEEMSGFCLNIIELVEEKITEEPRLVSWLIQEIKEDTIKQTITTTLLHSFRNNPVKSSILKFIIDSTSPEFRKAFFSVLSSILELEDMKDSDKSNILLNYLEKLSKTNTINTQPVLLKYQQFRKILEIVPTNKYSALFSRMVYINLQSTSRHLMSTLKKTLYSGSDLDRLVARTGILSPKIHDLYKTDFKDHNNRIIEFFRMEELASTCTYFIQKQEPANSLLYLKCLLEKYERKWSKEFRILDDTSLDEDTQSLLLVLLDFVTTFKGVSYSSQILKYLTEEGLTVDTKAYLLLMRNMRLQGYYNEAISIMNNIDLNTISDSFKDKWVEEIMLLMNAKFPCAPKVLIGYAGALYGNKQNQVLNLLNDLKILGLVYGNGKVGRIHSLDMVKLASVDDCLTGNKFKTSSLACIYNSLLSSIPNGSSPELILQLFKDYMRVIQSPENTLDDNDEVIQLFLKHLLYTNEDIHSGIPVSRVYENYAVSKKIFTYYEQVPLPQRKIHSLGIDLLIQTSLSVHKDFEFAARVIKLYRENKNALSWKQIYSFIQYHYDKSEFKLAEQWYLELLRVGANYKGVLTRPLFDMARKLNWSVKGVAFKWSISKKNRSDSQALATIRDGNLSFLGSLNKLGDDNSTLSEPTPVNFGSELAAMLHNLSKEGKT